MQPTVDVEKIRREQDELSEKFQVLREKELLSLQKQVITLESDVNRFRWIVYTAIPALIVFLVGFIGIKGWPDLQTYIKDEMKKEIEARGKHTENAWRESLNDRMGEVLRLHDELQAVIALYRVKEKKPIALEALQKLAEQRPTSEIIFTYYTDVLLEDGDYYSAIKYLDGLKKEKIFPGNFKYSTSFCNAGFISWIKFLREPDPSVGREAARDAQEWLEKAHDISKDRKILQSDIRVPLYRLVFLHLSQNQVSDARDCGVKYLKWGGPGAPVSIDARADWFKLLEGKRRHVRNELEEIFPDCLSNAKP